MFSQLHFLPFYSNFVWYKHLHADNPRMYVLFCAGRLPTVCLKIVVLFRSRWPWSCPSPSRRPRWLEVGTGTCVTGENLQRLFGIPDSYFNNRIRNVFSYIVPQNRIPRAISLRTTKRRKSKKARKLKNKTSSQAQDLPERERERERALCIFVATDNGSHDVSKSPCRETVCVDDDDNLPKLTAYTR